MQDIRRSSFAADKVKLRLNWMYYGSHAGFALGFVDEDKFDQIVKPELMIGPK